MTDSIQKIPYKELTLGKKLGEGGFGIVYKGSWSGEDVAIKTLRITKLSSNLLEEFAREATVMARLSNPRIIRLFGICTEPNYYAMIMAFMPKGDLYDLLSEEKKDLPWPKRWQLAADIGIGLSYLHKNKIIHRDLKSLNVLLDQNERAKITDFGLARLRQQTKSIYTDKVKGSIPWMAPELFGRRAQVSEKSDVYAYGMVLWEIASRKIPFSDALDPNIIPNWIMQGEREEIPKDCPLPFSSLIQQCWKALPDERPTVFEACALLQKAHPSSSTAVPDPKFTGSPVQKKSLSSLSKRNIPDVQVIKCVHTLKGHSDWVRTLTSLGGGLFASGCDDGSIKIWNTKGQCLQTIKGHNHVVYTLESLGKGLFASGSQDKTIKIWNAKGQCLHTLQGHKDEVRALTFLGGGFFASGSRDNTIKIWSVRGKYLRTLEGHSYTVYALASLGGGVFASGSMDKTIKIWNTSGRCLRTLEGHGNWVYALASLGKGGFASGSGDKTIKIWNAKGQCLHTFEGHTRPVYTFISLGGGLFASGSQDSRVKIWDSEGQCLRSLNGHTGGVLSLISLGSNFFASSSADKTICIWSKP